MLRSAYKAVLREARDKKIPVVACSLISAGIFRGSQTLAHVIGLAVDSIAEHVYPELEYFILCGYTPEEKAELQAALHRVGNPAPEAVTGAASGVSSEVDSKCAAV